MNLVRQILVTGILMASLAQLQQLNEHQVDTQILRRADGMSDRQIIDFLADPSLMVTLLHTLEVAYWTLPFGFLLMPLINFFRVPNRRKAKLLQFYTKPYDRKRIVSVYRAVQKALKAQKEAQRKYDLLPQNKKIL